MVSDAEMEKFVAEELKPDITQNDSIDPSVNEALGQMGWLYKVCRDKIDKDHSCFVTKKKIPDGQKMYIMEAAGVEAGLCAFVSVSEEGKEILEKQQGVEKNG